MTQAKAMRKALKVLPASLCAASLYAVHHNESFHVFNLCFFHRLQCDCTSRSDSTELNCAAIQRPAPQLQE